MKGLYLGYIVILILLLVGCATENILEPVNDVAYRMLGRRVGYHFAVASPAAAEATRPAANEILLSEDTQSAAIAFGEVLNNSLGSIEDPLLLADIADLADLFIAADAGAQYLDILKQAIKGYLFGLDLGLKPPAP